MRLNIASATNVFPYDGWINYDREKEMFDGFFHFLKNTNINTLPACTTNKNLLLAKFLQSGGNVEVRKQDLRGGFAQHEDNSIDAIYLGQMIEHLNPIYETPRFLSECYRMLKPGGVIRITTPDLDMLINAYINNQMDRFISDQPDFYKNTDSSAQLAFIMYGACGPRCTWDYYEGHMFLFTEKSMSSFLTKCNYKNITFYREGGKSLDPILAEQVFDAGMSHSFITEAIK